MAGVMVADATIQATDKTAKIKTLCVMVGVGLSIFFHKEHLFYGLLLRHEFQTTIKCSVSTREDCIFSSSHCFTFWNCLL